MSDLFNFDSQFERISSQLSAAGLAQTAEWITKHTFLGGRPFSFFDHEYQLRVAQEQAQVVNIRKPSQIGISELSLRLALAFPALMPGNNVIYILPTLQFARNFSTTRIDPVISGSPTLRQMSNAGVNNAEIKSIGENFMFIRGTSGTGQAISIPASMVVVDEYDFCQLDVVSAYQSRLTHSKLRLKRNFSTPTVEGYGISAEFAASQQWWMQTKCSCCGNYFIPDYYSHVRVPGCTLDLRQITKRNIHKLRVKDAYVECPNCGGHPDLSHGNQHWTCLNPDEGCESVGIQLTPFNAPAVITPSYLIQASVEYARRADFDNFGLGLPSADAESALSRSEVEDLFVPNPAWGFSAHFMGVDMGHDCHILIGGLTPEGDLRVVHAEVVDYRQLEKRRAELVRQYRVICDVDDLYPYSETVYRMQHAALGRNLWAAQFVEKKTIQAFDLKHIPEDRDKAQPEIREVHINRNRALDALLELLRTPGGIAFAETAEKPEIVEQLVDMKRIKEFTAARQGTEVEQFVWVKSKQANDHYHHALLYLYVATQLKGTVLGGRGMALSPVLGKLKAGRV